MPKYVVEVRTSKTVKYLVESDKPPTTIEEIKGKAQYMHQAAEYEQNFSMDGVESTKEWVPEEDGCGCHGWYHDTTCPNWVMTL